MSQDLNFHSQNIKYVSANKTVYTRINEPFLTAGKQLGWKESPPIGFGLNDDIIQFVLKRDCYLVVSVSSAKASYWISAGKLKHFLQTHNCNFVRKGVNLKVISWLAFVRLQEHVQL